MASFEDALKELLACKFDNDKTYTPVEVSPPKNNESIEAPTNGEGETPLQWAIRCAKEHHLQFEVEEYYHRFIAEGQSPEEAATNALIEWDV